MVTHSRVSMAFLALLVASLLTGCSPSAQPPATTAPAPQVNPTVQTPAAKQVSPEEIAWNKIVEIAKKQGTVTFYTTAPFIGDVNVVLSDAFKKRFGITLNIIVASGGSTWGERLKTEKRMGQQVGDVLFTSLSWAMNFKADGLTAAAPDLPVLKRKDIWRVNPLHVDTEGHLLLVMINEHHPFANANLLKPKDEPTSYYDFLQPKWKGKKIIVEDPRVSSLEYLHFTPLVNAGAMKWEFFADLAKQEPLLSLPAGGTEAVLSRGEAIVSLSSPDLLIAPLVLQGIPLKSLSMKEGDTANVSPMLLLNGAPHPNAARLFINWFLEGEGAAILAKEGTLVTNSTVPDMRPDIIKSKSPKQHVITLKDAEDMGKLQREGLVTKLLGLK